MNCAEGWRSWVIDNRPLRCLAWSHRCCKLVIGPATCGTCSMFSALVTQRLRKVLELIHRSISVGCSRLR